MNKQLLLEHIKKFQSKLAKHQTKSDADYKQRQEDTVYYTSFNSQ